MVRYESYKIRGQGEDRIAEFCLSAEGLSEAREKNPDQKQTFELNGARLMASIQAFKGRLVQQGVEDPDTDPDFMLMQQAAADMGLGLDEVA